MERGAGDHVPLRWDARWGTALLASGRTVSTWRSWSCPFDCCLCGC